MRHVWNKDPSNPPAGTCFRTQRTLTSELLRTESLALQCLLESHYVQLVRITTHQIAGMKIKIPIFTNPWASDPNGAESIQDIQDMSERRDDIEEALSPTDTNTFPRSRSKIGSGGNSPSPQMNTFFLAPPSTPLLSPPCIYSRGRPRLGRGEGVVMRVERVQWTMTEGRERSGSWERKRGTMEDTRRRRRNDSGVTVDEGEETDTGLERLERAHLAESGWDEPV